MRTVKELIEVLSDYLDCSIFEIEYTGDYDDDDVPDPKDAFIYDGLYYYVLDEDQARQALLYAIEDHVETDPNWLLEFADYEDYLDKDYFEDYCFDYFEEIAEGWDEDTLLSECRDLDLVDEDDFDELTGAYIGSSNLSYEYAYEMSKQASNDYGSYFDWYKETQSEVNPIEDLIHNGVLDIDYEALADDIESSDGYNIITMDNEVLDDNTIIFWDNDSIQWERAGL